MIFIPSNKVPTKNKTYSYLVEAGIDFRIVHSENLGYPEEYFLQSPVYNDRHLQRKRQFIFEHAKSCGMDKFWTVDDDIQRIEKPDYESGTIRRLQPKELPDAIIKAEALMDETENCGILLFRSRFFWMRTPKINYKLMSGTPFILWNVAALEASNANFSLVQIEEDCFVMAQLMGNGFTPITFGEVAPSFNYSWGSGSTDEQILEFAEHAPEGSVKWVQRNAKRKYKHRRMMSDRKTFLMISTTPVLKNDVENYFR